MVKKNCVSVEKDCNYAIAMVWRGMPLHLGLTDPDSPAAMWAIVAGVSEELRKALQRALFR